MPYRSYYVTCDGELQQGLSEDEIQEAFQSKQGVLWVDVFDTTEEDGRFLEETFGFHPLTVEDCVSTSVHPPKIDVFDDYLFIVVHGINYAVESELVETTEMAFFLGPHFVVSNHNFHLHSVEAFADALSQQEGLMQRGADFLAHSLISGLINNITPTISRMGEVMEEVEEEVLQYPRNVTLESILKLKRSAMRLNRVLDPQREVLNRLGREKMGFISEEAGIFYRDVYDHLVRLEGSSQNLRDRTDNAANLYLSSLAARQNETMRILAIVATIFMPLTLVAGIYGMNFDNMPELTWSWGYFAVLGVMATVIGSLVWWFWARDWLTWGRRRVSRIGRLKVDPEHLVLSMRNHIAKYTKIS